MKVLIVGAGGQGGACASILARQDAVEEIRLVDLKEETAQAVAKQIDRSGRRFRYISADSQPAHLDQSDGNLPLYDCHRANLLPYRNRLYGFDEDLDYEKV